MLRDLAAFALSLSALAAAAAPALAQDESAARLSSRTLDEPRLSTRALPAAPTIHRLSIGPLAAPAEEMDTALPDSGDLTTESLLERAQRGDGHANYRLGLKYLAGDGVARDLVEAFARIRLAAEAGHPRAISLFYFLGAKLTADEHGQAFERSRALRAK
jgi:TPR repeat protein